jgi:protein-tyrosine phosphatase
MPFIENISRDAVSKGFHYDAGQNAYLIQIVDNDCEFPTPLYSFKDTLQLKFLDVEDHRDINPGFTACTADDAQKILEVLLKAKAENANVIVHCHAGVCRSGAVSQFAIDYLGFQDTESYRIPNLLVKQQLTQAYFEYIGI